MEAAHPPSTTSLTRLREAAAGCRACPLWQSGTQTVFGAGGAHAAMMFVGEQPGDEEDKVGQPFVGPAGRLLDKALVAAGIEREQVYVTNVVKHFKWRWQGGRRLHQKPVTREIRACRPWLDAEIAIVQPQLLVCLGATAAQAILGKDFRVTRQRGELLPWEDGRWAVATVHPSAILRIPDTDMRRQALQRFTEELHHFSTFVHQLQSGEPLDQLESLRSRKESREPPMHHHPAHP